MFGAYLFCLVLLAAGALGNIYPTRPVANTVFSAGRTNSVTWINDGARPPLQQLGPMSIELYVGGDRHVATLASNVEPTKRSQKIWISPTLGHNGSDYHIRFVCEDPPQTIFTSDFTVTMMSDMVPFGGLDSPRSEQDKYESTSVVSLALPTDPVTPTLSAPSISTTMISPTASQVSDPNPYADKKTGSSGGSIWRRTSVDLERAKFRLVFILWPVLIGITMAL